MISSKAGDETSHTRNIFIVKRTEDGRWKNSLVCIIPVYKWMGGGRGWVGGFYIVENWLSLWSGQRLQYESNIVSPPGKIFPINFCTKLIIFKDFHLLWGQHEAYETCCPQANSSYPEQCPTWNFPGYRSYGSDMKLWHTDFQYAGYWRI